MIITVRPLIFLFLFPNSPSLIHLLPQVVLQVQRDPKTGNLVMLNRQVVNPQQLSNGGNHGYHPGRHLHHQLQMKAQVMRVVLILSSYFLFTPALTLISTHTHKHAHVERR